MKKASKKLSIHTDTLRTLSPTQLTDVKGAGQMQPTRPSEQGICGLGSALGKK